VAISTDAAGAVTGVRILATSGSSKLDAYTCDYIQRCWRFPAGPPMTRRQPVIFKLR
jgi:TonB family protein